MLRFVSPLENTQFGFKSMPCVGTGSFMWLPQPLEGGQCFRGSQESALDTNSDGATATMGKDNDKARKGHFLWPHLAIRPGRAAQSLRVLGCLSWQALLWPLLLFTALVILS